MAEAKLHMIIAKSTVTRITRKGKKWHRLPLSPLAGRERERITVVIVCAQTEEMDV